MTAERHTNAWTTLIVQDNACFFVFYFLFRYFFTCYYPVTCTDLISLIRGPWHRIEGPARNMPQFKLILSRPQITQKHATTVTSICKYNRFRSIVLADKYHQFLPYMVILLKTVTAICRSNLGYFSGTRLTVMSHHVEGENNHLNDRHTRTQAQS